MILFKPKLQKAFRIHKRVVPKVGYSLMYPEGIISINETSYEILYQCDGINTIDDIKSNLLTKYNPMDINEIFNDIDHFLQTAYTNKWITY